MKKSNIVNQDYWDSSYTNYNFSIAEKTDPLSLFINNHGIIHVEEKTCLEIGCFPGRYLAIFGELGYVLNGIDLTPRVEKELKNWFINSGFKVNKIEKIGLEEFSSKTKFDIVCSFGFIEHFINYEEIINKHLQLVSDSGKLILTTPNFAGFFQRVFHKMTDNENLSRHYLPSMNPKKWAKIAEKEGFEIEFCGYFGEYDFWVDIQKRSKIQLFSLFLINKLKPFFSLLPKGSRLYSPYCGLVAKRKR